MMFLFYFDTCAHGFDDSKSKQESKHVLGYMTYEKVG